MVLPSTEGTTTCTLHTKINFKSTQITCISRAGISKNMPCSFRLNPCAFVLALFSACTYFLLFLPIEFILFFEIQFMSHRYIHTHICKFQVFSFIVWHLYSLHCEHHHRSCDHSSPYSWPSSPILPTPEAPSLLVTTNLFSVSVSMLCFISFVHWCFLFGYLYRFHI